MTVLKSLEGEIKSAKEDAQMRCTAYDAKNKWWKEYDELVVERKNKCKMLEEMAKPPAKLRKVQNVAVKAIVKQCDPSHYVDLCESEEEVQDEATTQDANASDA